MLAVIPRMGQDPCWPWLSSHGVRFLPHHRPRGPSHSPRLCFCRCSTPCSPGKFTLLLSAALDQQSLPAREGHGSRGFIYSKAPLSWPTCSEWWDCKAQGQLGGSQVCPQRWLSLSCWRKSHGWFASCLCISVFLPHHQGFAASSSPEVTFKFVLLSN